MKTALIILACNLSALCQVQNADSVLMYHEWTLLGGFNNPGFKFYDIYKERGSVRCQWQSWMTGFHPTNRIQIDLVLDYNAIQVLQQERWILLHDLYQLYLERPLETLEVMKRSYKVEIYKALFFPAYEKYDILPTRDWMDFSGYYPNPDQGWYRRTVVGAPWPMSDLAIAIKRLPDVDGKPWWHLSTMMVLNRVYSDTQEPDSLKVDIQKTAMEPRKSH